MSDTRLQAMRENLRTMYESGQTTGDMETYLCDMSAHGRQAGMAWSAYLSSDDQEQWLDNFMSLE